MGAQEKRILSNSPDTRIVDSRSTCNYEITWEYSLARRKTGKKTNPFKSDRSNPAKTRMAPQARLTNHRERRTVREFFAVVIERRLEGFLSEHCKGKN